MKIDKNTVVSLLYELREDSPEGKLIENIDETRPMTFIYGSGQLLPGFESQLLSLEKGENFNFLLTADQAYGEKREEMIVNIPISVFQTDGKTDENICRVGNDVPMTDNEGNRLVGIINEITDSHVRMDFNHPMAGTNLYFSGRILDIREATAGEVEALNHSCSSCGSHDQASGCSGSCG